MGKSYKYQNLSTAPMAFYRFLRVTLVIGAITRICYILKLLRQSGGWYEYPFICLSLILSIVAIVGLKKLKWYGPLAYFGMFFLTLIDRIGAIIIIDMFGLEEMSIAEQLGVCIAASAYYIPVWIYFRKRRLLFDPPPKDYVPETIGVTDTSVGAVFTGEQVEIEEQARSAFIYDADTEMDSEGDLPNIVSAHEETISTAEPAVAAASTDTQQRLNDAPSMRFCRKCGARLLPDSRFCSFCGTAVMEGGGNDDVLS